MAEDALTFMELIQSFRRGELLDQADQRLVEVIDAIRDTGGDGCLTITLPFKMNKAGQIECTPDLKAKVPRRALSTGIFYANDDGRLTRRDPNQMDMMDDLERARKPRNA